MHSPSSFGWLLVVVSLSAITSRLLQLGSPYGFYMVHTNRSPVVVSSGLLCNSLHCTWS